MENNIINPTDLQLKDEFVISIKRVSKATTGGRRMRFRAIVVVGDGNGHVGIGFGRANEVASAVDKAKNAAKKRIFKSPLIKEMISGDITSFELLNSLLSLSCSKLISSKPIWTVGKKDKLTFPFIWRYFPVFSKTNFSILVL